VEQPVRQFDQAVRCWLAASAGQAAWARPSTVDTALQLRLRWSTAAAAKDGRAPAAAAGRHMPPAATTSSGVRSMHNMKFLLLALKS
jgi:hypothetical protein